MFFFFLNTSQSFFFLSQCILIFFFLCILISFPSLLVYLLLLPRIAEIYGMPSNAMFLFKWNSVIFDHIRMSSTLSIHLPLYISLHLITSIRVLSAITTGWFDRILIKYPVHFIQVPWLRWTNSVLNIFNFDPISYNFI